MDPEMMRENYPNPQSSAWCAGRAEMLGNVLCDSIAQWNRVVLDPQGPEHALVVTSAKLDVMFAGATTNTASATAEAANILKVRESGCDLACALSPWQAFLTEVNQVLYSTRKLEKFAHRWRDPESES